MEVSAAAVATAVLAVGLPASTAPAEDGVKVGAGAEHRQMRGLVMSLEVLPTSHAAYPARAIARAAEASPQIV